MRIVGTTGSKLVCARHERAPPELQWGTKPKFTQARIIRSGDEEERISWRSSEPIRAVRLQYRGRQSRMSIGCGH